LLLNNKFLKGVSKLISTILIAIGAIIGLFSIIIDFKNIKSDNNDTQDSDKEDLKMLLNSTKSFIKFIGGICLFTGLILLNFNK